MKIRGTGPIPVVVATIFSLSAIVALAAAGGTIAQENLTVQASTAATNFPRQPSSGIVLDGKNPVGPTAAIGLPHAGAAGGAQPSDLGGVTYNSGTYLLGLPAKVDSDLSIVGAVDGRI